MIEWKNLETNEQAEAALEETKDGLAAIFKHSTRCHKSSMAKYILETEWLRPDIPFFLVDVIQHRKVSSFITEKLQEPHESPQFLFLQDGECIYEATDLEISAEDLRSFLEEQNLL